MSKKTKNNSGGLVYSTNPNFLHTQETHEEEETSLAPEAQKLKVQLDSKQRAGKIVTLISGFIGTTDDLEALAKKLKMFCGTGGSAKDHQIIIQGDYKEKIVQQLKSWGYTRTTAK